MSVEGQLSTVKYNRMLSKVFRGYSAFTPEIELSEPADDSVHRVAVIGNKSLQPLAKAIEIAFDLLNQSIALYSGLYNFVADDVFSHNSSLLEFRPDTIFFIIDLDCLLWIDDRACANEVLENLIGQYDQYCSSLNESLDAKLFFLVPPSSQFTFGGYEAERSWELSPLNLRSKFLMSLKESERRSEVVDLDAVAFRKGRDCWHDTKTRALGDLIFNPMLEVEVGTFLASKLRVVMGKIKKVLIVDLDNTLWGGVLGDDGEHGIAIGEDSAVARGYLDFQRYLKQLSQRGILLAICSKNDNNVVINVFDRHRNFALRLDDFVCVEAGWGSKSESIRRIAKSLNLSLDSCVFLDDNPAELLEVFYNLPEVLLVRFPAENPWMAALIFETSLFFPIERYTESDFSRKASYRSPRPEVSLTSEDSGSSVHAFLKDLKMEGLVRKSCKSEIARLAQMEAKTNQFNLTTRRRSLRLIEDDFESDNVIYLVGYLVDKYSDHGLVGYMRAEFLGDHVAITDWIMSCRVIGRTLEELLLQKLRAEATHILEERGSADLTDQVVAEFVETEKNYVAKKKLMEMGFITNAEGHLVIDFSVIDGLNTYIIER